MDASQANVYVADLGQALGLGGLSLDEGGTCLLALGADDDLIVSLGLDVAGGLRIMICLDDVVPEGEQLAEILTANLSGALTEGGTFALLPETGALVLHRRCGVDELQAGGLTAVVAGLAGVARHWRSRLGSEPFSSVTHSFLGDRV
ncbi:type III secretion system chaperone [Castellaniella hirudinis]|uniref:Type III secretion system chaperone n=1 Tax=Castellaniella hirudinis TaxID=1144617 RepID=A0ABV8RZI0_9BURK